MPWLPASHLDRREYSWFFLCTDKINSQIRPSLGCSHRELQVDPGREELLPVDDGYIMELFIEIRIVRCYTMQWFFETINKWSKDRKKTYHDCNARSDQRRRHCRPAWCVWFGIQTGIRSLPSDNSGCNATYEWSVANYMWQIWINEMMYAASTTHFQKKKTGSVRTTCFHLPKAIACCMMAYEAPWSSEALISLLDWRLLCRRAVCG